MHRGTVCALSPPTFWTWSPTLQNVTTVPHLLSIGPQLSFTPKLVGITKTSVGHVSHHCPSSCTEDHTLMKDQLRRLTMWQFAAQFLVVIRQRYLCSSLCLWLGLDLIFACALLYDTTTTVRSITGFTSSTNSRLRVLCDPFFFFTSPTGICVIKMQRLVQIHSPCVTHWTSQWNMEQIQSPAQPPLSQKQVVWRP